MKILIINNLYHPNAVGGAEKSVEVLAEGFMKEDLTPVIVSTADIDHAGIVNGVRIHYRKIPNLYWVKSAKEQSPLKKPLWHLIDSYNPFVPSMLAGIIEKESPDVVHTNNLAGFSVAVWKAARRSGVPIVHTIRDHYLLCPRSVMYRNDRNCTRQCLDCRILSFPRKMLSLYVDGVVGVSRFILQKHLNFGYFRKAKIKTAIYNAADMDARSEIARTRNNTITFGCAGMLVPIKGFEYLIERFKKADLKDARLHVYGKGLSAAYERRLIERCRSDKIRFMGHRKPEEIYSNVDVMIIPSLADDAFPRVLIESYSHGVPVIASNRGGAPEMIAENRTGFLFDPACKGDLEEKMRMFSDDRDKAGGFASYCLEAAGQFAREKIVKQYMGVYRAVMK
ncbi:MAG: glycosyltransferase family 4 protein [Candidatus Zixiibacteriota bacterium]|nr:MAG: glycosyltransferase family 4 protein [candidate division Zixibacteria bacterium]